MESKHCDLCVIGAGPGGYVAAIRAAHLGMNVKLVERNALGGTCLNIGCIPTKTLIASADVLHNLRNVAEFGIDIDGDAKPNLAKMQARMRKIVGRLTGGISALLKAAGVEVIVGEASFSDQKTIRVNLGTGKYLQVKADKYIIAAGSEPAVPAFIPESKRVITSTELLAIKHIPKRLLILGGGVIGCEFASLFAELGSDVTVVEMMPSILPALDQEVSRTQTQYMRKSGVSVLTGQPMTDIKATSRTVKGRVGDQVLTGDYLLVAIGRKPNLESLNVKAAGLKQDDKGWLPVDVKCRTNVPGIYAIGDVTGTVWQLAHFASAMALCAVDNIVGKASVYDNDLVPGCIFTRPEIATVGLSTEQCSEKGLATRVGKFPFAALGKAMAINETEGFIKIIADANTDQILGVHIIGPHATDLISEAVTAMKLEVTAEELGKVIHPHPTLGEGMMEAAHAVHDCSIHVAARKKRSK